MKFISIIPQICEWTALMLSVFIAVKSSLLFSYYQKIGTLSLYYLYSSLFGLSMSMLQFIYILTEMIPLPPHFIFFKFVVSILICINFIGFMYLLWKRPREIGILRIAIFTSLYAFAMMAVPLVEGNKMQQGILTSTFNLWYYPIAAFASVLLLCILYYYWKIAHFKNGLSIVVIFSLIPFLVSVLFAAMNPTGTYPIISYIAYVMSLVPLTIKLTTEGFDSGHKHNNDSYRGGAGE